MRIRRKRTLLTVATVAGAVALYGCGGGDSGPDKTPFNQTDVDKAAADAKKKAEMEAAAAAAAMAEAGTAAAEAKKAMEAAAAAKMAAADAAKHAMTATLDKAMAMAASANASTQSGNAAAAAKAARAAADKARTAAAGHQAAKDAEASAKAAEKYAMEAAASAAAAMRSYETAKSVKADRDATGVMATAAGVHAETARQQAKAAKDAADMVKDEVKKAKDATTEKDAEDARTAATKARADAKTASEAADAAKEAAEAIRSEAPAVTMKKDDARKHAKAAAESLGKAGMYFDYTAGYADARKARGEADAGKMDLASHARLMGRVPWIGPASATASKLDDAARRARDAAEGMERSMIEAVIDERKGRIASALGMAISERAKADGDLTAAKAVYNAAVPFSENGMGIDADNLASGKTLRHPSGKISVNGDDGRVWAADQPLSERGPYDVIGLTRKWGVVSFGKITKLSAARTFPTIGNISTDTIASYQVHDYNKWNLGIGLAVSGPINTYKYVSYGVWGRAKGGYPLRGGTNLQSFGNLELTEAHAYVFADPADLAKNTPETGTASYFGYHVSYVSIFTGNKGSGGRTVVIADGYQRALDHASITNPAGKRYDDNHLGVLDATIDFAANKVGLKLNDFGNTFMFYDVNGIDLNSSTGTLSGGTYSGRTAGTPSASSRTNQTGNLQNGRPKQSARRHDPFKPLRGTTAALVPTMKLHGGVFGPNADELAGTIELTATVPHGENAAGGNLATAKDGWIRVTTSFAAANQTAP